jgi:transitional endoplasmic reticulum ATPase
MVLMGATIKKSDVISGDEVEFHADGNPKITLPRGMTYGKAFTILERLQKEAETPTTFERTFRYRPDDGAHAAFHAMKARFGMALGKLTETFFGIYPAETRTINIGVNATMQVPWGRMEIPTMPGMECYLMEKKDTELGPLFHIAMVGPKKWRDEAHGLFNDIQDYLQTHSIYRGKALIGAERMEFMNVDIDPDKIVFSDDVTAMLEGTVWAPIRYSDAMRRGGVPLKRALLLHGPYGTGKSSAGLLTAQVAEQYGWTFLSAKPGRDKIEDVLRTARLYEPAVVFVEDIDNQSNDADSQVVTRLLDAFDGITAKGGELMIVLTTNHLDRIHKGMLRPGRLDAIVEIAGLDRHGVERLIKAVVPEGKLTETCDYDAIYAEMDGFLPAFVRETCNRAVSFAIARTKGVGDYTIDTPDLVYAAASLHAQLNALNDAGEGVKTPTLDVALTNAVADVMSKVKTWSPEYEDFFAVKVEEQA